MKKNNPLWILAIVIISILLILNIVISLRISEYNKKLNSSEIKSDSLQLTGKTETGEKCPDAEGGLKNAALHVKYFYSPFCPWCRKEEPILQKIAKNHGNLIHIEWYNINSCPDLTEEYKVGGVPTMVFSTFNNQTEYSHYGFIYEEDLTKLMCDVTGGC